jgi:DNA-binding transcriptional MerR regulator
VTNTTTRPHALLPQRHVAERYGVSTRTIIRWEQDPRLAFPPVVVIRKRRYYDAAALEAWDQDQNRDRKRTPKEIRDFDGLLSDIEKLKASGFVINCKEDLEKALAVIAAKSAAEPD